MSDTRDHFIGNPNECAIGRLTAAGIAITNQLDHGGETYSGVWVSQKCARKVYEACVQGGCITHGKKNDAFDLFHRLGGEESRGSITKIDPSCHASYLGARKPRKINKTPGKNILTDFGHGSPAFA